MKNPFKYPGLSLLGLIALATLGLFSDPAHAETRTVDGQRRVCTSWEPCEPAGYSAGILVDNISGSHYLSSYEKDEYYSADYYCIDPSSNSGALSNIQGMELIGYALGSETDRLGIPTSISCTYQGQTCPEPLVGEPPDCECPEGTVDNPQELFGQTRCPAEVQDPTDCANDVVFDTGVDTGDGYFCGAADDNCPSGYDPGTAYNPGTDTSVNTCVAQGTGSSSSSSSSQSSSGNNSSSDNDDGDGDGNGSSSDNNHSGSSSSSSSSSSSGDPQGECDPETETCENTASGGEDCGEPPQCQGDEIECAQLLQQWYERCPNTGLEEFDGIEHTLDMEEKVQQALDDYESRFNEIKGDFEELVSAHLSGSDGTIPSNTHNVHGQEIEIGIAARKDFFAMIRNLIYFGCLLYAFYIIMRA